MTRAAPVPRGVDPSRPLSDALERARIRLASAGVPAPTHDAEWLLLKALEIPRTSLWSEPRRALAPEEAARFDALIESRARRVPLQLLLGEVAFHRATLAVERGVFIPRPETECLVEAVLAMLSGGEAALAAGPAGVPAHAAAPIRGRGAMLDLCTGTGAVAIALLLELPGWTGYAVDRSASARALAERNAERNGVGARLRVLAGDLREGTLPGVPAPVDLLTANPPYVPTGAIPGLMPEVRDYDPMEALDGGPDGLDALRAVARGVPAWLKPGGILAIEIGDEQADASLEMFRPLLETVRIAPDLAGKPRVLIGTTRGGER